MLPNYCSNIANQYGIKIGKQVTNLGEKSKYVLHHKNLQLYLPLGTKLTRQHDWLKIYISLNTGERKNAVNSFGKDFFKLMISSNYGKTIENLRKRMNVRLINNVKGYKKIGK